MEKTPSAPILTQLIRSGRTVYAFRPGRVTRSIRRWTRRAGPPIIVSPSRGAFTCSVQRPPRRSLHSTPTGVSCGAAALATLLNYQHGDLVAEREIAKALIQRKEYLADPLWVLSQQGFSLLDLKRYADKRGYQASGYGRLTLQDLIEQAPIVVPLNLHGYNHFVVFRGRRGDQVLIADPLVEAPDNLPG